MSSFLSHFIRRLVERGAKHNDSLTLAELRRSMEKTALFARPPRSIAVEAVSAGDIGGEWHLPKHREPERALPYLHGGAFCSGSPVTHRHLAARIAELTQAAVLVPDYRLAPEHPFPAALDDAIASYHELIRRGFPPERIVVAGDWAGGNLALSLLLRLRDTGDRLPAAAVCLSPVTDLARSDEETKRRDAERARDAGVEVTLQVYPRMWHVWQIFVPYLPEARRAVRATADFVCIHAGRRASAGQAQR